jgi:phospholipase/carboxylesterase
MIPMSKALTTRRSLVKLGYSVRWHDYAIQHEMCMEEINDIRTWLIEVLGKKGP